MLRKWAKQCFIWIAHISVNNEAIWYLIWFLKSSWKALSPMLSLFFIIYTPSLRKSTSKLTDFRKITFIFSFVKLYYKTWTGFFWTGFWTSFWTGYWTDFWTGFFPKSTMIRIMSFGRASSLVYIINRITMSVRLCVPLRLLNGNRYVDEWYMVGRGIYLGRTLSNFRIIPTTISDGIGRKLILVRRS